MKRTFFAPPVAALAAALFLVAATATPLSAAQHVIQASGLTFVPATKTINAGDTVIFSINATHNAVQVPESSWNANEDNPLAGGFAVPFGGGTIVLPDTGTYFYICQNHILSGMKGKLIVIVPPPPPNTITINLQADQDGSTATLGDRIAKKWALKLYRDSVGSGIVVDSVNSGSTLVVGGLAAGTYVAWEADSAGWTHFSQTVDGVPQGATSQTTRSFTVGTGENRSVTFLNTAPNMILSVGLTFSPDTLVVDSGDTVFFVLSDDHLPREVSKSTWLANGTTTNGGFDLPAGGGRYVASAGGIDYYVCVPHAAGGMKGLVMVNPIPPSAITLNSIADQDGNHATTGDRVPKRWSLRLYQDSIGSGIVIDSVDGGTTLTVGGLGPGVYVAVEADSAGWTHVSQTVDGVPQGATAAASRVFSVGSDENRSVDFLNTAPNMIINTGFAFSPETLTVDSGEVVRFVLETEHNVRQVDSSTWAANDTVPNGGFALPFGGGTLLMDVPGDNYYVCVPHGPGGMKGIIRVHVDPYAGSLTDSVADGWNLLSIPFAMEDTLVAAIYPAAVTPAYVYESGYASRTAMENGPGFWIKFGGAGEVSLGGLLVESDTIPVAPGWNIVGSVSAPVPAASVQSMPPGLVTSPFFGYDAGYYTDDTVRPGRGYWIKTTAGGSIVLGPAPAAATASAVTAAAGPIRILPTGELPPPPPPAFGEGPGRETARRFTLAQNYPNPFNPTTRISYVLESSARVRLAVYNALGERVALPVDATREAGEHAVVFDASGLPAGMYVARLTAGDRSASVRMLFVK